MVIQKFENILSIKNMMEQCIDILTLKKIVTYLSKSVFSALP